MDTHKTEPSYLAHDTKKRNDMSYTPGPWASAARQGSNWDLVVYKPGTSLEICQMFHDFSKGNATGEANAKLVSAAPEMLDDCRERVRADNWLVEQLANFIAYQGSWSLEVGENFADSLIGHIKAHQIGTQSVIAKAEGR